MPNTKINPAGRRSLLRLACAGAIAGAAALPVRAQTDAAAAPDPLELIRQADKARGGGLPGLRWLVTATTTGGAQSDTDSVLNLSVKATTDASLAEILAPGRSKGTKMLQAGRNMWLSKPGLKKPIPISPRQRLTGMAATGDIAATNFAKDYSARLLREEMLGSQRCYVLELTANSRQSTYDRLLYWISADRGLGLQAEFLSLSGKPIKKAEFSYDNAIETGGKKSPFISKMLIADAVTDSRTTLEFSQVKVQALPAAEFDVGNL